MEQLTAGNEKGGMIVASFGGGVNSTAMLIGMVERGERCDLIIFADTGGEKPHTYEHIKEFSVWLKAHGMPAILTLRGLQPQQISDGTLEQECLRRKTLPSIAFGFKTCSQKWKRQPIERFLKSLDNGPVKMLLGFDADEPQRAKNFDGNRYPLLEWDWGRDECIAAIDRAGVKQPGKSACFFCPSSKKPEIIELRRMYPELAERAVAMEKNAELTSTVGLGRRFAWGDLYAADDAQARLIPDSPIEIDCGCYDGGAE
jgi:hypothetical protein